MLVEHNASRSPTPFNTSGISFMYGNTRVIIKSLPYLLRVLNLSSKDQIVL